VRIETYDDRILNCECLELKGIETTAGLREKFFDCAAPVLGEEKTGRTFDTLQHFERIGNLSNVIGLLA
jgi:hypothetical protein